MVRVCELAKRLIEIPGVVAVTLVDSRRLMQPDSELGVGLYYRDALRAEDVRALGFEGTVVEPGEWGRLANGGGKLTVEGQRVDLRYRELDVVQHWIDEAEAGNYDVDGVEGYVAGNGHLRAGRRARVGGGADRRLAATAVSRRAAPGCARTRARQRGLLARYHRNGCGAPRRCLVRGAAGEGSHRGRPGGVRGARRLGSDREGHRARGGAGRACRGHPGRAG